MCIYKKVYDVWEHSGCRDFSFKPVCRANLKANCSREKDNMPFVVSIMHPNPSPLHPSRQQVNKHEWKLDLDTRRLFEYTNFLYIAIIFISYTHALIMYAYLKWTNVDVNVCIRRSPDLDIQMCSLLYSV